jgi:predicted transcriptional regulator
VLSPLPLFNNKNVFAGSRGRPAVQLDIDQLKFLQERGFTAKKIAQQLGCSASFVYKRLASDGVPMRQKFSNITDQELEARVAAIHEKHPNAGNEVRQTSTVFNLLAVAWS